jgi:hypothetical protein
MAKLNIIERHNLHMYSLYLKCDIKTRSVFDAFRESMALTQEEIEKYDVEITRAGAEISCNDAGKEFYTEIEISEIMLDAMRTFKGRITEDMHEESPLWQKLLDIFEAALR